MTLYANGKLGPGPQRRMTLPLIYNGVAGQYADKMVTGRPDYLCETSWPHLHSA